MMGTVVACALGGHKALVGSIRGLHLTLPSLLTVFGEAKKSQ